jgi:kynurenine formamidase
MDMNHISYHPAHANPAYQYTYTVQHQGPWGDIKFVAFSTYSTLEHMGTHVDAPYHFYQPGKFMDQVPLEDLIGPLVRIDITKKAKHDRNAVVSVKDLTDWEKKHGKIPTRSFVLLYSGWDQYYGNNELYVGTGGEISFPGFSGNATEWLILNRDILGIGTDTISCDAGNVLTFQTHINILSAGKVCVENLRNLGKVPASGARFAALPIMLKNSTGAQARVFAVWGPEIAALEATASIPAYSFISAAISMSVSLYFYICMSVDKPCQ